MVEWLLSGQNTQESMQVSRPMTVSTAESQLNNEITWFTEQLAGDTSDFDQRMRPTAVVQDWVYLNISYFVRNVGSVMPFDPTSLGAPPDLITEKPKVPLGRMLGLPIRFYRVYSWAARYYRESLPALDAQLREMYATLHAGGDDLLDLIWRIFSPEFYAECRLPGRAHIVISMIVTGLDSTLRQQVPELLGLFAGNETTTSLMGQRIWELSETASRCGEEVRQLLKSGVTDLDAYNALPAAAPFVEGVRVFLKTYGHRGFSRELDFEAERLADHPEHILLAVGSHLNEHQPPQARAAEVRQGAEAALARLFFPKRALWKRILGWGQQLLSWREDSKSCVSALQAVYGLSTRYLARHFYPDDPDDMMLFYTLEEFLAFAQSQGEQRLPRDLLDRRRAEFELHKNQNPPPELIWYDPDTYGWRPALAEGAENDAVEITEATRRFQGLGASQGRGLVEGIALVTNDPIEAGRRLLDIEGPVILVTRLTDPAWSSLFGRLTAVVTELGGLISHAAIVARENGLPAVVGAADVTHWVRNGQRVRVDGAAGIVEIVE